MAYEFESPHPHPPSLALVAVIAGTALVISRGISARAGKTKK